MKTFLKLSIPMLLVGACSGDVSLDDVAPSKDDVGLLPGVRDVVGECFTVDDSVKQEFHGGATQDLGLAIDAWEIQTAPPAVEGGICRYDVRIGVVEDGVAEAEVYDNVAKQRRIRLSGAFLSQFRYVEDPYPCDPNENALLLGVFAEALRAFQDGIGPNQTVSIASPGCKPMLPTQKEVAHASW